jgi:hypothetical protein
MKDTRMFTGLQSSEGVNLNGLGTVEPYVRKHNFLQLYRHANALTSLSRTTYICEQLC